MKVRWNRQALRRLEEIHSHIGGDALNRATLFCERIIAAAEQLESHPFSGPLLPEDGAYRQLVVEGYRLVYRIADDGIYVMTIVGPGMLVEGIIR